MDERTEERFAAPGSDLERFNYGWSVMSCLASGMDGPGAAGTLLVKGEEASRVWTMGNQNRAISISAKKHVAFSVR